MRTSDVCNSIVTINRFCPPPSLYCARVIALQSDCLNKGKFYGGLQLEYSSPRTPCDERSHRTID